MPARLPDGGPWREEDSGCEAFPELQNEKNYLPNCSDCAALSAAMLLRSGKSGGRVSEVATASDIVPTPEAAENATSVTVKVSIYSSEGFSKGTDGTVMVQVPVSVQDRNESGTFDIDDVLTAAHEKYCADGYEGTGTGADRKIVRLWNQSSGNFQCFLNDSPVTNLEEEVRKGDCLVACILGSVLPTETVFTYLTQPTPT